MGYRLTTLSSSSAAADLLMGLYLVVIATADEVMRGQYNAWAHSWMTSWVCTVAGVLSMLSSEVPQCSTLPQAVDTPRARGS